MENPSSANHSYFWTTMLTCFSHVYELTSFVNECEQAQQADIAVYSVRHCAVLVDWLVKADPFRQLFKQEKERKQDRREWLCAPSGWAVLERDVWTQATITIKVYIQRWGGRLQRHEGSRTCKGIWKDLTELGVDMKMEGYNWASWCLW